MAAPFHNIEEKAEDAMAAVIADQATLTGMTTFKGFDSTTISTPALEIFVETASPGLPGEEEEGAVLLGNWNVEIVCRIRTSIDDTTRAAAAAFVAKVRDVLIKTSLASDINTLAPVTDFTVDLWLPGECTRFIEDDDTRICEQRGMLYCRPQ